jgi:glucan phosphoethanolaminetransferase (alkaline phosphatase superfamily)
MGSIQKIRALADKANSIKLSALAAGANVLAWALVMLGFVGNEMILVGAGFLSVLILTVGVLVIALPLSLRDVIKPLTRMRGLISLGLSLCVLIWNIHSFATWDL